MVAPVIVHGTCGLPTSSSSLGCQNAMLQARSSAYSVNSEVSRPPATSAQSSGRPDRRRRLDQPQLAEEAGHRWDAGEIEGRDQEEHPQQWPSLQQRPQSDKGRRSTDAFHQAGDQEERGLHDDVVRGVEDCGSQASRYRCPPPPQHETDVRDQRERKQLLDVVLSHRPHDADDHGDQTEDLQ